MIRRNYIARTCRNLAASSPNYISKYSGSGDVGTGARSLYDKRLLRVAVCVKENRIILAGKVSKIMVGPDRLEPDFCFAIVK